jgi:hypothetical protein
MFKVTVAVSNIHQLHSVSVAKVASRAGPNLGAFYAGKNTRKTHFQKLTDRICQRTPCVGLTEFRTTNDDGAPAKE